MEQTVTPRHFNPVRALIKGILHFIVKTFILTGRAIKRFPIPALIVAVMLLGSIFALSNGTVQVPGLPGFGTTTPVGGQTAATGGAATGERATVENFLKAQQELNATGMLEAFSDEIRANPEARANAQSMVEQMRVNGLRYTNHRFIASTQLDDGRTVALYIVTATDGQRAQQMPFTFTLDKAYKIIRID